MSSDNNRATTVPPRVPSPAGQPTRDGTHTTAGENQRHKATQTYHGRSQSLFRGVVATTHQGLHELTAGRRSVGSRERGVGSHRQQPQSTKASQQIREALCDNQRDHMDQIRHQPRAFTNARVITRRAKQKRKSAKHRQHRLAGTKHTSYRSVPRNMDCTSGMPYFCVYGIASRLGSTSNANAGLMRLCRSNTHNVPPRVSSSLALSSTTITHRTTGA